jgi:hypothetical protein
MNPALTNPALAGAPGPDLVSQALREPEAVRQWPVQAWSQLLQQARMAAMLPRLAHLLNEHRAAVAAPLQPCWPSQVAPHFVSALRVCSAQHAEVRREAGFIQQALQGLDAPVLLLKGAAYVMAGLPAAAGRVFSDIDIMVPKAAIGRAESLLTAHGWVGSKTSAYDQRYYREWMHELPPMEHLLRHTALDVHHTILPETARLRPAAHKFFEAAVPLPDLPGLFVLSPTDMVLHSMTHLFMNEEMSHGLRDLSDLDLLLRHFGQNATFWPDLLARAAVLDLQRPLFYGLRYTARQLNTPVPASALQASSAAGPGPALRRMMDALWSRALAPAHPSASPPLAGLALFALYLRGHWLRMPPWMLARHLTVKALRLHGRDHPGVF